MTENNFASDGWRQALADDELESYLCTARMSLQFNDA